MVGVFRRSLSFPNKNLNRSSQNKPHISHHIRSISLPCRSHPLISQIKDEITDLTLWVSTSKSTPQTFTNISHALTLLKDTHETLQHILHLPQTLESLRSHPLLVENLLEDFLRFVDAYGMFQTSILSLKEQHSSAQIAIRKRNESKVVAYAKAKKKMANEMQRLVCGLRRVTQRQQPKVLISTFVTDAEVRHVIADVMSVTMSVSVALFNGIAMSFSSRRLSLAQMVKLSRKSAKNELEGIEELREQESLRNLKKKGDEEIRTVLKRMRDLEECICGIESVCDKVFRALINSRVALLNTLTLTH
ncbi:hypothetical protein RJT34_08850 [Clitoria ternatea]|uniref:DUF241 domain protein n=1 Tax=Clitoria ternatea TaxID=43366 RepID=A0AAN9K747_CLITE